jgi:hypothetical protein
VCGIAADISEMEAIIAMYMHTTIAAAIRNPPNPAAPIPPFHPEKSPEMTAATPIPHSPQIPAVR